MDNAASNTNGSNVTLPNTIRQVRMSDGQRRLVLGDELTLIDDCYEYEEPISVDSLNQVFHVSLTMGGGNATFDNILQLRGAGATAMKVTLANPHLPQPGDPPHTPEGFDFPKFTFFICDHLGNSRILYSNKLIDRNPDSTKYLLEHVIDYYPFGKTLREYVYVRERHQTTYHERDAETGLDNRGARQYDSEICRFLSVDPLAADYAAWGTYVYVLGNPVRFIDPDGKEPTNSQNWPPDGGWGFLMNYMENRFKSEVRAAGTELAQRRQLAGNGIANTTFGAIGTMGAVEAIPASGGVSIAAIPFTAAEMSIGIAQTVDALVGEADAGSALHQSSSLVGYIAYSNNDPSAPMVDALGQFIPGVISGGNIVGTLADVKSLLKAAKNGEAGEAALKALSAYDGYSDTKGVIDALPAGVKVTKTDKTPQASKPAKGQNLTEKEVSNIRNFISNL